MIAKAKEKRLLLFETWYWRRVQKISLAGKNI
jgi:hypothetical protein